MGLDFGFDKISKERWNSFNGDKEKYYEYFSWNSNHEDELVNLANWCGWGNPAERWFKEAFEYYDDYHGVLMRPITQEDLFKAIREATLWYEEHVALEPVTFGTAFRETENGDLTILNVDGIEMQTEDQAYHRFYSEDSNGRLFMTGDWVDPWDVGKYSNFIKELSILAINFDWDNDVLLYYVSY